MKQKIYIFLGLLAVIITFRAGVHVGTYQFLLMDASAKAVVIASDLERLRSGDISQTIKLREMELDAEIQKALMYQDSGVVFIHWPYSKEFNHSNYLKRVADYRTRYPSPSTSYDDPELQDYKAAIDLAIQRLISEYGDVLTDTPDLNP